MYGLEKGKEMYDFRREYDTYLSKQEGLLREHPGEFVAIYNGRIVAINGDRDKLIAEVREKLGHVGALVKRIGGEETKVRPPVSRRLTKSGDL